ncbi:hypothetical protein EJ110_NYTH16072 [Nymphaea thermarum]|nr:hypothetical protein EJ110_NYTH16072 [Nymphaea thermarum]
MKNIRHIMNQKTSFNDNFVKFVIKCEGGKTFESISPTEIAPPLELVLEMVKMMMMGHDVHLWMMMDAGMFLYARMVTEARNLLLLQLVIDERATRSKSFQVHEDV